MKVLILLVFFSSSVNASLDVLFFNEKMPKYKELNPITLESKDLLFKHPNDYDYQRIIVSNVTVFDVVDDKNHVYYKRTNNPEKVIILLLNKKKNQFIVIRKGEIKGKSYPRQRDLLTIDCMIDMKQDNLEGIDYVYGMCRKAKIEKKGQVSYTEIFDNQNYEYANNDKKQSPSNSHSSSLFLECGSHYYWFPDLISSAYGDGFEKKKNMYRDPVALKISISEKKIKWRTYDYKKYDDDYDKQDEYVTHLHNHTDYELDRHTLVLFPHRYRTYSINGVARTRSLTVNRYNESYDCQLVTDKSYDDIKVNGGLVNP